MKFYKSILVLTFSCLSILSCRKEPLWEDVQAPVIEIIHPSEKTVFYTANSASTPNTVKIQARATDDYDITFGLLTITDANGDLVDADVETNFYEDNTVMELVADFSAETPGTYKLNFLFRDANNNNASVTRTMQCLAGEEDIDESNETTDNVIFQFFASDKKNKTVIRVDIYNNGHSANLIADQILDAKGMSLYGEQAELLFGSTKNGLDVEIYTAGLHGEDLIKTQVSTANYQFGTLVKDQNQQKVYYFLESADLSKIPRHVLYSMNADGSGQSLVAKIENATKANAIQKILIYDDFGSPLLVMHDSTTLYVYNPEGSDTWETSDIFSQDGVSIHDIALTGENNKTVYMVLKSGNNYNLGKVNLDGSSPDLNFLRIAGNSPALEDNLPHRIQVDEKNQYIYWFTQSEDLQKSILKRANFNDTNVETIWETSSCICNGTSEEIRIADYQINTGQIVTPLTN